MGFGAEGAGGGAGAGLGELNRQFAAWVARRVAEPGPPRALGAGCRAYLAHLARLPLGAEGEDDGGALAVLGMGDMGQLGLGEDVMEAPVPRGLPVLKTVRTVACGGMHTICLAGGTLWSWGVNDEGALGRHAKTQNTQLLAQQGAAAAAGVPEGVPGIVELPAGHIPLVISAGDSHTICVSRQGAAFQWGTFRNAGGPFGMGSGPKKIVQTPEKAFPPAAGADAAERAVGVASGCDHVLLRTASGRVFSWGCAERGRLGRMAEAQADLKEIPDAVKRDQLTPTPVPGLPAAGATDVFCGFLCSFVLAADGREAYGFGLNNYGQLSLPVSPEANATNAYYTPERLTDLEKSAGGALLEVAGGEHHSLFLCEGGQVLSVGRTTYGRLGRSDVDVSACVEAGLGPVEGLPSGVTSVAAGMAVSACVGAAGELFTWGYGGVGQLCTREDDDAPLPVRVAEKARALAGRHVHQVSFGGQHGALVTVPAGQAALGARRALDQPAGAPSAKRRR